MTLVDAFEYVFPLVGCKQITHKSFVAIEQIYGTAFYLNNNTFITAGHCIKNALQHKLIGLGYPKDDGLEFHKVTNHEIISDYDIGFVQAHIPAAKALHWGYDELPMLADVKTVGYPYALDLPNLAFQIRAFKGHVISAPTFFRFQSKPRCYELSFACPRGLSGAPLFTEEKQVKGIIIGNASTEMLIYTDKEVVEEGKETVTKRYEATQFGIAFQTGSIKHVQSTLLGNSLDNYLKSVRLAQS